MPCRFRAAAMRGGAVHIKSLQNERVKEVVKLRERRQRDRTGTFLIEGYRELLRAAEAGLAIDELFICPELFLGDNEDQLIDRLHPQQQCICDKAVFQKMSYRDRPDGLLATAPQMNRQLSDINFRSSPFVVIAEAIEKPGNLGTILRTCDAVGADALLVCNRCTDIHNPNVVRASVGTLFTVPVVEVENSEAAEWLKQHEMLVMAATPAAESLYTEVDLTGPLAIAFGTEQYGLSDFWMTKANAQVRIPMMGKADSLNVAMSTGVLLYEVLRQRGF